MGRCLIASLFAVAACGPVVGSDGDTSTTGTPATTTENPTSATSASSASNTASTTATDPDTTDTCHSHSCLDLGGPVTTVDPSDTTSVVDTCGDFVCAPDFEIGPPPCDIWAQDCLRGYKCMPWADDGGDHWNANNCFPLDPNPAQPGDPCTAEGPTSGIDNCDIGTMCMFVDPDTDQGTCVPFCMGNEDNYLCEDPSTACAIEFDGNITTCLPACDPLLQDCLQGGCYATPDDSFVCGPTIGIGLGAGQTCGHEWECAQGYTCYDGAHVPDCEGDRCCAPFCDITVPGQCEELTCEPWFTPGQGPGQEPPIGVCIIE